MNPRAYQILWPHLFRYAKDESGHHWITIGGKASGDKKHAGGFPVQLDGDGKIVASRVGGLHGKHVSEVKGHFDQQKKGGKVEEKPKNEFHVVLNIGRGRYQTLRVDLDTKQITAASDIDEDVETPGGWQRPSGLTGEQAEAYKVARKAAGKNIKPFGFEKKAEPKGLKLELRQASRIGGHAKPMVAKITGPHSAYQFDRQFLEPTKTEHGGQWDFHIQEDGYYHVVDRNSKGVKRERYIHVEGGKEKDITREDLMQVFPGGGTKAPQYISRPITDTSGMSPEEAENWRAWPSSESERFG